MSIVIWRTYGDDGAVVWAPVLMCHECGEAIDRANDALCVWDGDQAREPANTAELLFVHRSSCAHRDLGDGTAEIGELLSALRSNLGLPELPRR